jgi:hypothetical protein
MTRKMTEWPSKRGPITKIMPSDGCKGDTVPLAVDQGYDFHEFGCHLGNVGLMLSSLAKTYHARTRESPKEKPRRRDGARSYRDGVTLTPWRSARRDSDRNHDHD